MGFCLPFMQCSVQSCQQQLYSSFHLLYYSVPYIIHCTKEKQSNRYPVCQNSDVCIYESWNVIKHVSNDHFSHRDKQSISSFMRFNHIITSLNLTGLTVLMLAGNVLIWLLSLQLHFCQGTFEIYITFHAIFFSLVSHVQLCQRNVSLYGSEYLWEWREMKICLQSFYDIVSVDSYRMRKIYPCCILCLWLIFFFCKIFILPG